MQIYFTLPVLVFLYASATAHAADLLIDRLKSMPCVVSVAHGRNLSDSDPKFNNFWNTINATLHQSMIEQLQSARLNIRAEFYGVEARDTDAKLKNIMQIAYKEQCSALMQLAAFSAEPDQITVEIAINALVVRKVPGGTNNSVGEFLYTRTYKYDTKGNFASTFVPSAAGEEYAKDILASAVRP